MTFKERWEGARYASKVTKAVSLGSQDHLSAGSDDGENVLKKINKYPPGKYILQLPLVTYSSVYHVLRGFIFASNLNPPSSARKASPSVLSGERRESFAEPQVRSHEVTHQAGA